MERMDEANEAADQPRTPMRFEHEVVARRVRAHPEGRSDDVVNITLFERESLASGVFSDVYSGTVTAPERRDVAIKKIWPEPGFYVHCQTDQE
jgi:hypothetical protein